MTLSDFPSQTSQHLLHIIYLYFILRFYIQSTTGTTIFFNWEGRASRKYLVLLEVSREPAQPDQLR